MFFTTRKKKKARKKRKRKLSSRGGKIQAAYSASQAGKHIHTADEEVNKWVAKHGVRLSGELGSLTYDGKKAYDDDGSILEVEGEGRETQVGDGLDSVEEGLDGDLIY